MVLMVVELLKIAGQKVKPEVLPVRLLTSSGQEIRKRVIYLQFSGLPGATEKEIERKTEIVSGAVENILAKGDQKTPSNMVFAEDYWYRENALANLSIRQLEADKITNAESKNWVAGILTGNFKPRDHLKKLNELSPIPAEVDPWELLLSFEELHDISR